MTSKLSSPPRPEWLITNGMGGFAMGSSRTIPSRRYHALLVASLLPPVQRIVALHSTIDRIEPLSGPHREPIDLESYAFGPEAVIHPEGHRTIARCDVDPDRRVVQWTHEVLGARLIRTLHLRSDAQAATLSWRVDRAPVDATFRVRPFTPLRDYHAVCVQGREVPTLFWSGPAAARVRRGRAELHLTARGAGAKFSGEPQNWSAFAYLDDRLRGVEWLEDLWSPGEFTVNWKSGESWEISLDIVCGRAGETVTPPPPTGALAPSSPTSIDDRLAAAAGQFIAVRGAGTDRTTAIIAGYPWFADWGRDSMIALRGLLLIDRRFAEAESLLHRFTGHLRDGLMPNAFGEDGSPGNDHSIDGSLWYIASVAELLKASHAAKEPQRESSRAALIGACLSIIRAYRKGTRYGIGVDEDGLVYGGDGFVPLTWMDARRDGITFSARAGKAVEINALWYHALAALRPNLGPGEQQEVDEALKRAGASFRRSFWWEDHRCLHDVLERDASGSWRADGRLRPNMVIAASLEHSPLSREDRANIVACAREHLLTPVGLRTLAREDPRYAARFEGNLLERDRAYHNGTVWPWLIGPYVEAVLRAGEFSESSRREASRVLGPLLEELDSDCTHQLAEVYDGDPPYRPGGCPAQAWSVAEVRRARRLIADSANAAPQ